MTGVDLNMADMVVIFLMGSGLILSLWRFMLGPSAPDRIVAADTLSIIITVSLVLICFHDIWSCFLFPGRPGDFAHA